MEPVGIVHSCFSEKFGIPRQPGLVSSACGQIEFSPPFDREEAFVGLEAFSHIWVQFVFHEHHQSDVPRLSVRPPRLGGNKKIGVFASRAPNRPNALGLSVVKLVRIVVNQSKVCLHIQGHDLLEGTPVMDIKPYIPYADVISDATTSFAVAPQKQAWQVIFSTVAQQQLKQCENEHPGLHTLIVEILRYDPRPAYKRDVVGGEYGFMFYNVNVRWRVESKNRVIIYAVNSI